MPNLLPTVLVDFECIQNQPTCWEINFDDDFACSQSMENIWKIINYKFEKIRKVQKLETKRK